MAINNCREGSPCPPESKIKYERCKKIMENKKKKIIIIAVIAVVVIGVAAAVYFAVNKDDNGYTDVPVTEVVTDENGEAVTDAKGQAVTEAVTDSNGKPQTTRKQQNSGENNKNTTAGNNNQGGNSGSGNGSGTGGQQPADKVEDKKPKNRKITVTAVLPQDCGLDDVMEIWINGEKDSEIVVGDYIESNSTVVVATAESYKDDAVVELTLRNYKTNTSGTILNNHEEIKLPDFPLNRVEGFTGEDD